MTREGLLRDPAFSSLKDLLIARTGLAYFADRDADLADRVTRRMARIATRDAAAYVSLLQSPLTGAAELEQVTAELTIGETYFFRYHEQFDALRDRVIPELIERRAGVRQLRFWSAGCSTGPEPYSLSILLKQQFGTRLAGWNVEIVGTDLNREFLDRARAARYGTWALRTLTEEQRQSAFLRDGEEWTVRPEYRQGVSFVRHNLVEDPLPSYGHGLYGFDVILCRNVMIYFDRTTIATTVERFRACLNEESWLLVGHSEPNLELFRTWETVPVPGATLYRNGRVGCGSVGVWECGSVLEAATGAFNPRVASIPLPAMRSGDTLRTPAPSAVTPTHPHPDTPSHRHTITPSHRHSPTPPHSHTDTPLELLRDLANSARWQEIEDLCRDLEAAERLKPHFHFYRAVAAEGSGRIEDAERCYRQALFLGRSFAPAHYHLGMLLESRGDFRQAERSFRNAAGILAKVPADAPTAEGDGVTAGELRHGVEVRLARLQERESQR